MIKHKCWVRENVNNCLSGDWFTATLTMWNHHTVQRWWALIIDQFGTLDVNFMHVSMSYWLSLRLLRNNVFFHPYACGQLCYECFWTTMVLIIVLTTNTVSSTITVPFVSRDTVPSLWWLGLPSNYPDISWCWIHLAVCCYSFLLSVSVFPQLMFAGLDIWSWSHWVNKRGLREVQCPIQALLEEIDPEIRNYIWTF